jgi:hypothetical protein
MSVTDPLGAAPLELRPLIRSVVDRLHDDFSGIFAEETIQRFMAESWESLSGHKVAQFIPLFVERFTRQRLRALARVEGKLTDTRPMVCSSASRTRDARRWLRGGCSILPGTTSRCARAVRIRRAS